MGSMLDIAGGIVIAAVIIGTFKFGMGAAIAGDGNIGGAMGWWLMIAAVAAGVWLVLIHSGTLYLS